MIGLSTRVAGLPSSRYAASLGTGEQLIVGLTPSEIAGIRVRIDSLLARIDRGEVVLY